MNSTNWEPKIVRKKYSPQFKDQALERSAKEGIPQVARDLGIKESMLYYWENTAEARWGFHRESQVAASRSVPVKTRDCPIGGGKCLFKKSGGVCAKESK